MPSRGAIADDSQLSFEAGEDMRPSQAASRLQKGEETQALPQPLLQHSSRKRHDGHPDHSTCLEQVAHSGASKEIGIDRKAGKGRKGRSVRTSRQERRAVAQGYSASLSVGAGLKAGGIAVGLGLGLGLGLGIFFGLLALAIAYACVGRYA